jgi:hypothetical protein
MVAGDTHQLIVPGRAGLEGFFPWRAGLGIGSVGRYGAPP